MRKDHEGSWSVLPRSWRHLWARRGQAACSCGWRGEIGPAYLWESASFGASDIGRLEWFAHVKATKRLSASNPSDDAA
jgi:hypothetical protein